MKTLQRKLLLVLGLALLLGSGFLHLVHRRDETVLRKVLETEAAGRRLSQRELGAVQERHRAYERKRDEVRASHRVERSRELAAAWSAHAARLEARGGQEAELTKADKLQRCATDFGLGDLPWPPPAEQR